MCTLIWKCEINQFRNSCQFIAWYSILMQFCKMRSFTGTGYQPWSLGSCFLCVLELNVSEWAQEVWQQLLVKYLLSCHMGIQAKVLLPLGFLCGVRPWYRVWIRVLLRLWLEREGQALRLGCSLLRAVMEAGEGLNRAGKSLWEISIMSKLWGRIRLGCHGARIHRRLHELDRTVFPKERVHLVRMTGTMMSWFLLRYSCQASIKNI